MKLSEKLNSLSDTVQDDIHEIDTNFHKEIFEIFADEYTTKIHSNAFQKPCIQSPLSKKIFLC